MLTASPSRAALRIRATISFFVSGSW